jgi:phasin family protein
MAKTQTVETEFAKVPDFTQIQAEFSKWAGDFNKYFVNGKMPSFDLDSVFALQRKNVEAFTAANQVAFDGVKAVAQRQAELARKAFEEFGKVAKEMTAAGTPEDKFAKQADLAKAAFEDALVNIRETVDTLQKSQSEAVDVISKRVVANIDELKSAVAKVAKK